MTRILSIVVASGLVLSSAAPAAAVNSKAGTSAAQFLKIGAGSRAAAMGEAYSALGDDAYALYYNPAALTMLKDPQLAASHTSYIQGSNYGVLGFAYPLKGGRMEGYSKHVLGAAIYNLSVSDIERRGTTETTQPLGEFDAGDYSYNLSYAYRHDRRIGVGATVKMIHQTLDTYDATAFGTDLGAHFTPRPEAERPFSFAAVVKNLGTKQKMAGIEDPLPLGMVLGAGAFVLPKRLKLEVNATKYRDTNAIIAVGGEFTHAFTSDMSGALRAGYSTHRKDNPGLNGVSVGMGLSFHRASFDFAWVPFGDLGNTFRYSLLVRFGKSGSRR